MTIDPAKLRLLLFDLDGVLLSEQRYLDAAALTVAQLAPAALAADGAAEVAACQSPAAIASLRKRWLSDRVLSVLRQRALNSNWDKAYACLLALYTPTEQVYGSLQAQLLAAFERVPGQAAHFLLGLENGARSAPSFKLVQSCFQSFFLGDPSAAQAWWQTGLVAFEKPLFSAAVLGEILGTLVDKGFELGVGTGRPREEALRALATNQLEHYFIQARVITFDTVRQREVEEGRPFGTYAKPHPFTYTEAAHGICAKQVCVIGDSPADAQAAKAAGFSFIGITDDKAIFQGQTPARHALVDSVLALPRLLLTAGL